jgi:multicomponent K+:H+ antiporter subunit G
MNGIAQLPGWAALIVSLLLIVGASIVLIGALGLVRLRTFYQRIHGPAITVSLGAGSLLLASMLYFTVARSRPVVHEIIITLFVLLTAPVVSMMIMRAAVYRDLRARRADAGATAGDVYSIVDEK